MLVLVADDDRAVREALERALQLHGYEVDSHPTETRHCRPSTRARPTPSSSTS